MLSFHFEITWQAKKWLTVIANKKRIAHSTWYGVQILYLYHVVTKMTIAMCLHHHRKPILIHIHAMWNPSPIIIFFLWCYSKLLPPFTRTKKKCCLNITMCKSIRTVWTRMWNRFAYAENNNRLKSHGFLLVHLIILFEFVLSTVSSFSAHTIWLSVRQNGYFRVHGQLFYDYQLIRIYANDDCIFCVRWKLSKSIKGFDFFPPQLKEYAYRNSTKSK